MSIIGIPIGFYAYAFPGNINLMVLELYSSKKYRFLIFALFLIVAFETLYCSLSLLFLNALKTNISLYKTIETVSLLLVFIMGIWMVNDNKKNNLNAKKNTVYRGIFSIIIHPQQIPFWVIMGVIVNQFVSIHPNNVSFYQFVFFNAIGTLLAMGFYIVFGTKLFDFLKLNLKQINKLMGTIYIVLALYGLFIK